MSADLPMTPALTELEASHVDSSLAADGAERVAWARSNMPVLAGLREELARDRPLAGRRIGMCLHVEMTRLELGQRRRHGQFSRLMGSSAGIERS